MGRDGSSFRIAPRGDLGVGVGTSGSSGEFSLLPIDGAPYWKIDPVPEDPGWRRRSELAASASLPEKRRDRFGHQEGDRVLKTAWDPTGEGRSVVRGGFGRFYGRFPLNLSARIAGDPIIPSGGVVLTLTTDDINSVIETATPQTLTHLRDLLREILEGRRAQAGLNQEPTVDHPGRRQPHADTFSLGVEHEFRKRGVTARLDLTHTEHRDVLLEVDLNPFSRAREEEDDEDSDLPHRGRPNISILGGEERRLGSITSWINAGSGTYRALQLSLRKRPGGWLRRLSGRISYTYGESSGNYQGREGDALLPSLAILQRRTETGYDFDRGTILGKPPDPGLDDPRTRDIPVNWHRRHNFVASGAYQVRETGGLVVAWAYRYLSGARETLLDKNVKLDNSGRLAPAPARVYDPEPGTDIGRSGTRFNGKLQGAEEPDFSRLDLSLLYRVRVSDRLGLTLRADVFNVTNEVNFDGLGGNKDGEAGFLVPNQALNPREYQVGARFEF